MTTTLQHLQNALVVKRKAKEEYEKLKQQFCKEHHPLKVGDIVEVTGYSHKGKQMVVKEIWLGESTWRDTGTYIFKASGPVLKKSGEPGQLRGEWKQEVEGS